LSIVKISLNVFFQGLISEIVVNNSQDLTMILNFVNIALKVAN